MYNVNTGVLAIIMAQHVHGLMEKYQDWDIRFLVKMKNPDNDKER